MELELGLKITHNRDDITSFTNLQIAKDSSGPLFVSRETDTMFVLTGYLKGFKRENVKIKINKDGNRIMISGQKPVQEMVMVGWIMQKKEVVLRNFEKVFRIPDGIIVDKIDAKFVDEDLTLIITMPKVVKGICGGAEIQEVQEHQELERGKPVAAQTLSDDKMQNLMEDFEQALQKDINRRKPELTQEQDKVGLKQERAEPRIKGEETIEQPAEKLMDRGHLEMKKQAHQKENRDAEVPGLQSTELTKQPQAEVPSKPSIQAEQEQINFRAGVEMHQESDKKGTDTNVQETMKPEPEKENEEAEATEKTDQPKTDEDRSLGNEIEKEEEEEADKEKPPGEKEADESKTPEAGKQKDVSEEEKTRQGSVSKKSGPCTPLVVAGSAFLVSLIVVVIELIRDKRKTN